MRRLLLISMLGSSSFLFTQTVCIGTVAKCREQLQLCASEPAPANLELSEDKIVTGTVLDPSGATFNEVEIELRTPKTSVVLQSTEAKNGKFDVGKVKAGSYRLIVVSRSSSGLQRLKGWNQATRFACKGGTTNCELTFMLTLHGTDNPIDYCPPK